MTLGPVTCGQAGTLVIHFGLWCVASGAPDHSRSAMHEARFVPMHGFAASPCLHATSALAACTMQARRAPLLCAGVSRSSARTQRKASVRAIRGQLADFLLSRRGGLPLNRSPGISTMASRIGVFCTRALRAAGKLLLATTLLTAGTSAVAAEKKNCTLA